MKVYWAFLLLSSLLCTLFSNAVFSAEPSDADSPYFIEGYDVVSYFRDTGPQLGWIDLSTEYNGKKMLFASETNLADFLVNPDIYMPAYDGYCAYGMVYGMKSKIDPLQYDIVDGRLYLQLDQGTKWRWNRKISRYIKKSDKAWKKLSVLSDNN